MSETLREATAPQDRVPGRWFDRCRTQRERLTTFKKASGSPIQKWEADLGAPGAPELRQPSVDRRVALRDRFGQPRGDLDNSKQCFEPPRQKLSDSEIFLPNDLTATGVQQVGGRLNNIIAQAGALGAKVDAGLAKLDALISEPAPPNGEAIDPEAGGESRSRTFPACQRRPTQRCNKPSKTPAMRQFRG